MQLEVTKELRTETAHRLINYDGKCSHLHGHSYLWQVTASADNLDSKGMIVDFKDLKKAMEALIGPLDHALLLHVDDPLAVAIRQEHGVSLIQATNGESPRYFVWPENPTAENMAVWALHNLGLHLPTDVRVTKVRVWETATSYAEAVA